MPGCQAAPFREFVIPVVRWRAKLGDREVPIRGSGHYRVGGEFALTQQLELDLQIGDAPAQHFDSGVVVGGGEFPKLDIRVSVNGQFCYDTVIDVIAAPVYSNL